MSEIQNLGQFFSLFYFIVLIKITKRIQFDYILLWRVNHLDKLPNICVYGSNKYKCG